MSNPPADANNAPADANKKKKKSRTVYVCDKCQVKHFKDFNEAVKHEESCTGPPKDPPPLPLAPMAPLPQPKAVAAPPAAVASAPKGSSGRTDNNKALKELKKRQAAAPVAVSSAPKCTGRAAVALEEFREKQREREREGRSKPDMIAYSELKTKHTVLRHGEIPGVPVGVVLYGRGEAAILGIHTQITKGIDGRKDEPCYAICVSGGYKDDNDHASDGTIIYTGTGGQDKNKRQVKDQEENADNVSLMRSIDRGVPVRVLRGRIVNKQAVYVYEGLYKCVDYTYEPSDDGPKVYKFILKPLDPEKIRSFEVNFDASRGSTNSKQKGGNAHSRLLDRMSGKKRGRL